MLHAVQCQPGAGLACRSMSAAVPEKRMKKVSVYRWNPEVSGDKPKMQTYEIDLNS